MRITRTLILHLLVLFVALQAQGAVAAKEDSFRDYRLGAGDAIHVFVFQNTELSFEARVGEGGEITYPLIGAVNIGGLTIGEAETKIADKLTEKRVIKDPQVHIVLGTVRGSEVSVLGQVNRAGRFPLEKVGMRLSEVLASAGGIITSTPGSSTINAGADSVIVTGVRDEKRFRRVIDLPAMYLDLQSLDDIVIVAGDVIYVPPAPVYYIYGEVQRPGAYVISRNMTVQQAMAQAGGPTIRGSEGRLRLDHRDSTGVTNETRPAPNDSVRPDDVLYVPASLF
jgi:polysaccharide biosynthesis/export protein